MSDKIAIRAIASADEADLIAFWRSTWTATYGPSLGAAALKQMLDQLDRDRLAGMLPGTGERGYCATAKGRIVGTAILAERGPVAYLWGMYARPDRQRSGLRGELLAEAVAGLATASEVEVRALTSSPWAVGFYRKCGFDPQGEEETTLIGSLRSGSLVLRASVAALKQRAAAPGVSAARLTARRPN